MMMDCIQRTRVTEAEGISGYMPEADASGEALDDDDEEGAEDASSSALTIALFAGQYLLLDTIATLSFTSREYSHSLEMDQSN